MTEKLICPFCGGTLNNKIGCYVCPNNDCECCYVIMPARMWQALIDGKKAQQDLEITKTALKAVKCMSDVPMVADLVDKILEHIEHKE